MSCHEGSNRWSSKKTIPSLKGPPQLTGILFFMSPPPQHSMSADHNEGLGLDIGWVLDIMFLNIENVEVECYGL